jgi:hypothetical protein
VSRAQQDGPWVSMELDLITAKHIRENRMERETTELQKEAKAYLDAMRCESARLLVSL